MKKRDQHISADVLADRFLDLWQDNIRAWAIERELLTPSDLLDLLQGRKDFSEHEPEPGRTDPE